MPPLWRVVKRKHAATAFDGKAAQRFGGRWSSPGRLAVYASATKSLAVLEVLVHLDVGRPLPAMASFRLEIDAKLIEVLSAARLPRQWRRARALLATRQIGDQWLAAGRSLAFAVPSAIVPEESNYLLNPLHPGFARLQIGAGAPFVLDPRLVG